MAEQPTAPKKNYLPGGIILCVFPVVIYYVAHDSLELQGLIFLVLAFLCGVWTVVSSLFRLDTDSAVFWIVGATMALGFAVFAFLVAWREVDGWSSSIPFVPAAWNQIAARTLFAFGGLLALVSAAVFLWKARKRFR